MKIKIYQLLIIASTLLTSACFTDYNDRYLFRDNVVEIDEATSLTRATGKDYPIISRTVTTGGDPVRIQVNMIGEHLKEAVSLSFRVVPEETTAEEGRDFELPGGNSYTIDPGSSFGELIIAPSVTGVGNSLLVLELLPGDDVAVSDNYKRIGIRCVYP